MGIVPTEIIENNMQLNPFTPGTFTCDNPPIPWEFWPENLRARTREVNHMRSKAKDKIKFSNKLPFEVE